MASNSETQHGEVQFLRGKIEGLESANRSLHERLERVRKELERAGEAISILYMLETTLIRRSVCLMLKTHPEQGHGGGADTADLLEMDLNRLHDLGKYWVIIQERE